MKRVIALVFVVAVVVSAVFAPVAGAVPGNGQGGPENGMGRCTAGSLASPGLSWGVDLGKCRLMI
jgi:hypothetical protein